MKTKFLILAIAFLFAMVGAASADTLTFDLNVGNDAISGYSPPYANVLVNLINSGTAELTVTAYSGYLLGGAQVFGFEPNGLSGLGILSWTGGNASTDFSPSTPLPGQIDGFGSFGEVLDNFDGFPSAVSELNLIAFGSGWTSASDVLGTNDSGHLAAAHIFVIGADGDAAVATGFASNGSASVPEPSILLFLGIGLASIMFFRKRCLN